MKFILLIGLLHAVHLNGLKFNPQLSVALIEDIDRFRVARDVSFQQDEDNMDSLLEHGHGGLEDPSLMKRFRFTNEWVVVITGGPVAALALADEMGYEIIGQVPGFKDTYRLHKLDHPRLHKEHAPSLTRRLSADIRVLWAEQQFGKRRQKRGYLPDEFWPKNDPDRPLIREKRAENEEESNANLPLRRKKREDMGPPIKVPFLFNDELWDHQWYMHDTRTKSTLPRLDLHVLPVYNMGITGKGVKITILDDGLERNHTDLKKNYDPDISYDINDDDDDPTPRYDGSMLNSHGTRCAGEIAMEANNEKCGVGVAYESQIGGIRMLDGTVSDRVEATSLSFALDKVDIYSASWGPSDDGQTVEGPGRLARQALYQGILYGRHGKGSVYVWAAGNGGIRGDNCNCDGYVSSIYTVSIGSASQRGAFPWYGEKCASTMAVTYSSGAYTDQKIATVDLNNTCTMDHTGTSAAAPLAAGIIALALQANPNLTWRDVQHLIVWTSEYSPLRENEGWHINAAGFRFNLRFGFGLMNAAKYVQTAANWTNVPEKSVCLIPALSTTTGSGLSSSSPVTVLFNSNNCRGTSNEVNYLEHVEVVATIDYPIRGSLQVDLISPSGTKTQVLKPRMRDGSNRGFINWPFMSVHTWGENPGGQWQFIVTDMVNNGTNMLVGQVINATLILHGTAQVPSYFQNGPRIYDDTFNELHQPAMEEFAERPVNIKERNGKFPLEWSDLVGLKIVRNS